MERFESKIIQVAPGLENYQIKEMELFGWSLQSRQDIQEQGLAYTRRDYFDKELYITEQEVEHYVKLHFIRSLSLPNLDRIRKIELEYFNLPFPFPEADDEGAKLGCFFFSMLLGLWGFYMFSHMSAKSDMDRLPGYLFSALFVIVGIFILKSILSNEGRKAANAAKAICLSSHQRRKELKAELKSLL